MVDSKEKGTRAELKLRDVLRQQTGYNWERTPYSGALHAKHMLKGDLYIPGEPNVFCVEVKHYADDHLTSSLLTHQKPQLLEWWNQADRQAKQANLIPILFFKYDRSKWFVATSPASFDCKTTRNLLYSNEVKISEMDHWFDCNKDTSWVYRLVK